MTVWRGLPLVVALLVAAVWICNHDLSADDAGGPWVRNAGFEEDAGPIPAGWTFEKKAKGKGAVDVVRQPVHGGSHALRLTPNERNQGLGIARNPLGVGQGFSAGPFRGKKVYVSGWLGAEGGATAVLGVYALQLSGGVEFVELKQSVSPKLTYHEDVLTVPDSFKVLFLIVNCHVEGISGAAYFDDIAISLDPPRREAPAQKFEASVEIDAGRELHRIPDAIFGANIEWIWGGNGLWNDALQSLDPTLVRLSRELGVSQLRFPGGIFADFYHWKDGIGPRDRRPVRLSMPGGAQSANTFGLDEALELSKQTGAPLLMTVNIVTGTPQEAVECLRYVQARCAATGAPRVAEWELGNEQYVHDGSPHAKAGGMTAEHYAEVWWSFAKALRAADPHIRLGAIADENYSRIVPGDSSWTETVLKRLGSAPDFLSVHNAYAPASLSSEGKSVREVYQAMLAAPLQIAAALDRTADKIVRFAGPDSQRMRIAVTEWGPFFDVQPSSRFVDHVKTLGSALYVASTLRVLLSSPRVEAAHFFKLNDRLFMGWIGERQGHWTPKAPYFAFQMFRRHFGRRLIASSCDSPTFSTQTVGWTAAMPRVPYVETIASKSDDGQTLYVIAINKNMDQEIPLKISIQNANPDVAATVWTLTGSSIDANTGTELPAAGGVRWAKQAEDETNPRFEKGGPGEIEMRSSQVKISPNRLIVPLPKFSVVSLEIHLR